MSTDPLDGAVSVELYAFLNRSEISTRAEWQAAIDALKLPLALDPELDPSRDSGFSPCSLRNVSSGFEYSLWPAANLSPPSQASHLDSAVVFRWGGDLAECACAMGAAAALASQANAVVYYPADDLRYSVEELVHEVGECLRKIG